MWFVDRDTRRTYIFKYFIFKNIFILNFICWIYVVVTTNSIIFFIFFYVKLVAVYGPINQSLITLDLPLHIILLHSLQTNQSITYNTGSTATYNSTALTTDQSINQSLITLDLLLHIILLHSLRTNQSIPYNTGSTATYNSTALTTDQSIPYNTGSTATYNSTALTLWRRFSLEVVTRFAHIQYRLYPH